MGGEEALDGEPKEKPAQEGNLWRDRTNIQTVLPGREENRGLRLMPGKMVAEKLRQKGLFHYVQYGPECHGIR